MDDAVEPPDGGSRLPDGGSALLAFKAEARKAAPGEWAFAANLDILDDPAQRLAEFEAFDELEGAVDEHERDAIRHALDVTRERELAMHLQPDEAELQPYLAAVEALLSGSAPEPELPVAILPHLLLGDKYSAWDAERLHALGVTCVVNCADASAKGPLDHAQLGLEYVMLDAEDSLGYDILQHRAAVADHVRRCRERGGVCLLHCHAGINRSAALAVAQLMVSERLPLLEAVARCQQARGPILWNPSFRVSLVRLAREEALLGPRK